MTFFTISEETEKIIHVPLMRVTLEQAVDDVVVRLDGLAVMCFRAQEGVVVIMPDNIKEKGLGYREE